MGPKQRARNTTAMSAAVGEPHSQTDSLCVQVTLTGKLAKYITTYILLGHLGKAEILGGVPVKARVYGVEILACHVSL